MTLNTEGKLRNIFGMAEAEEDPKIVEAEIVISDVPPPQDKMEIIVAPPAEIAVDEPEELSAAEKEAQEDYEFSRKSLKDATEFALHGLQDSLTLAQSIDKPAGFEAVASMVKAVAEANRTLQEMHKSAAEIRIATQVAAANNNTQNINVERGIVFNGSPDELLKLIDQTRK